MVETFKLDAYKQRAYYACLQHAFAKNPLVYKRRMLETLGLSENLFFISCDNVANEEDIEIVKTILRMSKEVILLVRDQENFTSLVQNYGQQIALYQVSKLEYALSSDIHIFLHDMNVKEILCKHAKAFNTVHPLNYPVKNIQSLSEWGDAKKLNFFFGKEISERIVTFEDLVFAYFKHYLSDEEIGMILSTFGLQRFYLFFKYALSNRAFLERTLDIMSLSYQYGIKESARHSSSETQFLTLINQGSF